MPGDTASAFLLEKLADCYRVVYAPGERCSSYGKERRYTVAVVMLA